MLTLNAGEASLVLAPESGSGILGWTRGTTHILRHAAANAVIPTDVRQMAGFPLVPYSNRIADGRFSFGGIVYRVRLNFGSEPNSIHGVGWQRAWQVTAIAPDAVTETLHHTPDADWPFAFTAELQFHLSPNALRVDLSVTNQHSADAPAGLGLHPFFPRSDATLRFNAATVWRNGPAMLPIEQTSIPAEWDHTAPRKVGSATLDNCFAGWDGTATLAWPDRTLTIEASDIFRHVIVFTPAGQDFFCVEPVSHMNNAINHGAMRVLAPGETLNGTILFRLS